MNSSAMQTVTARQRLRPAATRVIVKGRTATPQQRDYRLPHPQWPDLIKGHKGTTMRNRLPTQPEFDEGIQTVFFQIANGNARQSCSVKTKFPTQQQASRYLRQNWNKIEKMARDCLANGTIEDGQIKLVML